MARSGEERTARRDPSGLLPRDGQRERGRKNETHRFVKSMPRPKLNAQSTSSLHLAEDLRSSAPPFPFIVAGARSIPPLNLCFERTNRSRSSQQSFLD
jgi:hypothetical protein